VGYRGGFQNLVGYGATCVVSNDTGHFWRSLRRDLRAGLWRDSAVLPCWFWAFRAQRKKLFKFFLVEFDNVRLVIDPMSLMLTCTTVFSSVEKTVPSGVAIFCLVKKLQSKIIVNCKENYNEYNLITKQERIFESPLCLKLDSSCGDGEWNLFSVDRLNDKLLLDYFKDAKITPLGHGKCWSFPLKKTFLSLSLSFWMLKVSELCSYSSSSLLKKGSSPIQ